MKMKTNAGLMTLLENLREEIDQWELDSDNSAHRADTIRYGLYLIAMDVLWCEAMTVGGYDDYKKLSTEAKLPETDYHSFAKHLAPFIEWLRQVNAEKLLSCKDAGLSESQAIDELFETHQTAFDEWLGRALETKL